MHPHLLRSRAAGSIRSFFNSYNYQEIITPLITQSPAIEPYLQGPGVIFSNSRLKNCFLPTSPEFYLKRIWAASRTYSGYQRIFEIAHSFRDESESPYHAPEFIMVEWYKGESHYLEFINEVKELLAKMQKDLHINEKLFERVHVFSCFEFLFKQEHIELDRNTGAGQYMRLAQNFGFKIGLPDTFKNATAELKDLFIKSQAFSVLLDFAIERFFKEKNQLLFLYGFPVFLRGMAAVDDTGLSQRVEAYFRGLEIANGYQEMDSAQEIEELWQQNNHLRQLLGLQPNEIDNRVVETAHHLSGVAGMAMGLERVLMALCGIENIDVFSHRMV